MDGDTTKFASVCAGDGLGFMTAPFALSAVVSLFVDVRFICELCQSPCNLKPHISPTLSYPSPKYLTDLIISVKLDIRLVPFVSFILTLDDSWKVWVVSMFVRAGVCVACLKFSVVLSVRRRMQFVWAIFGL